MFTILHNILLNGRNLKNLSSLKIPKVKKQSNEKEAEPNKIWLTAIGAFALGAHHPQQQAWNSLWALKAVFVIPSFSPGYLMQGPSKFPSLSSSPPLCPVTQWVDSGRKVISVQLSAQFCPLDHSPLLPPTCPTTGGLKGHTGALCFGLWKNWWAKKWIISPCGPSF